MVQNHPFTVVIPLVLLLVLKLTDIARNTKLEPNGQKTRFEGKTVPIIGHIPQLSGEFSYPVFNRLHTIHFINTVILYVLVSGSTRLFIQENVNLSAGWWGFISITGTTDELITSSLLALTLSIWMILPLLELDHYGKQPPQVLSNEFATDSTNSEPNTPIHFSIVLHGFFVLVGWVLVSITGLLHTHRSGIETWLMNRMNVSLMTSEVIYAISQLLVLLMTLYIFLFGLNAIFLKSVEIELQASQKSAERYYKGIQ